MKFLAIGDGGDGNILFILLLALLILGAITYIISRIYKKQGKEMPLVVPDEECCGAHEVCVKESLLNSSVKIDYYEDEELDRFAGQEAGSYNAADEEEFREILLTLQENEVAGWLKSIQLRRIELPEAIKEEAMLIVRERRFN